MFRAEADSCGTTYKFRPQKAIRRSLTAFGQGQGGAVTVEFVILLPAFLLILTLIVSASLLFATASDVQQLAHEFARASMWTIHAGTADPAAECAQMRDQLLQAIAMGLPNISPDAVVAVDCAISNDMLQVSVSYDLRGNLGRALGQVIGLDVANFTRVSAVRL